MKDPVKLGKLLPDLTCPRDAVHVAIVPVMAAENLLPGQKVGFVEVLTKKKKFQGPTVGPVTVEAKAVGVVDCYLPHEVMKGDKFYLMLYPGSITSLRHDWTHPAFEDAPAAPETGAKAAALAWITAYAIHFEISADELLAGAKKHLAGAGYINLNFDTPAAAYGDTLHEFWTQYEIFTGKKVEDKDSSFFNCSC